MNKFKTIIASCLIALSVGSISTAIVQSVNASEVKAAIPSGLYDDCEAATTVSDLWTAVKDAANKNYNQGTTYDGLWTWYWTTDKRSDGKMNDYYSSSTNYTSSGQCGTYTREGDCYNREHTIPKSWWNSPSPGAKGYPQTDIVIVIPTDGYVNNRRNNFPLGETDGETYKSNNSFSKLGSSTLTGYTNVGTVFEVNDKYKGDFARIHFYALAKWNNYNFGQDSTYSTKMFRNTTDKTESNKFGFTDYSVALFKKWHEQDPVDDWERQRNEKVYGLQGNRNPFVDHPEYADYLWGGKSIPSGGDSSSSSESSSSSSSSSSTSSGSVTPSDYTLITSNSSLSNGDLVVIKTADDIGVTGNGSGNAAVSETESAWKQYVVGSATSSGFTLYDSVAGQYIASPTSNTFGYSSTAGTCSVASDGALVCNSRTLCKNNSFYRFYGSVQASYSKFFVYKVESGSGTIVAVTGLNISNSSASLTAGGDTTISATVTPSDATNKTVNWTSSNTSVATVSGSTSQSGGSITIHAVAAGNATITASSDYDSSIKKTCTVTVNAVTPAVTSVTLNKSTLSLAAGKSETLTATVVTVGGAAQTVNWESSNTDVATVTSGGVVTVKSTATVGQTATITATSTVDAKKKASCTVTVTNQTTETLVITRNSFATAGGYAWYDWSQNTSDSTTITGKAELYTTTTTSMQFNKSKGSKVAAIFNINAIPGSITKIEATTASGTNRSWNAYVTSTACSASGSTLTFGSNKTTVGSNITIDTTSTSLGTSNAGYSFFCLQENDTSASYLSQIKITYTASAAPTPTKTLSSISISGYDTSFTVGDTFSFGGTVTANYSDDTTADVTASASFSGYDMSSAGNQTVTVSYTEGGVTKDKTYDITVSAAPTPTTDGAYKLVSDASKLRVGDKVIIVNTDGTGALSTTQNSNNRASTSVSKNSDGTISISDSVQSLELKAGTTSGTFSFYTGSGYLYAASSSKNYLRTETSLSANSSFTIAIAENIATVTAQGTNTNKIMRYNANNGNPIFSCYSSADNTISIYKKLYTAVEYSKIFLEKVDCDSSGINTPSQTNWSSVKDIYTNELSSDAKTTLSDATAHEYKNPSTDEQYLAQAMYQYDYIILKYNKTSIVYEKFITGRASNGLIFNGNIYASNMNDNIVPILVIIGILSLTGAGIILFVRKRKEI